MTNSFQAQQSDNLFRSLSLILAGVSIALVGFVATLIIANETTVAHGESIDDPQQLNSEFFTENNSDNVLVASADSKSNKLATEDNQGVDFRGILAQAQNQNQTGQCDFLTDNLRIDLNNDSQQVYRLQAFLQAYAYDYVELTGEFDEATLRAVQAFQTRHAEDILEPWGYEADEATGYVYITTRHKINEIYCNQEIELTNSQQSEITNYRQKLNRWRAQGAEFDTPQYLAEYRSEQNSSGQSQVNQSANDKSADESTTVVTNDQESGNQETEVSDTEDTATETTEVDSDVDGTSTTATGSSQVEDEPGFFDRLFGRNGSNESDTEEVTTTTESDEGSADDDTATSGDTESATEMSATSSVDKAATSVYSGVNSFVGFIFSPTFLLILLGVLILLLIATLLEDENNDAYTDITADDFAKDFDDTVDEADATDDQAEETTDQERADSKTQSADFDDTPAGGSEKSSDDGDDGKEGNLSDTSSSS